MMGLYPSTYIGPVIIATRKPTTTKIITESTCLTCNEKRKDYDRFCAECGGKIDHVVEDQPMYSPNWSGMAEIFDNNGMMDSLSEVGDDYRGGFCSGDKTELDDGDSVWLPNSYDHENCREFHGESYSRFFELGEFSFIDEEMRWMEEEFKNEIELMEKHYKDVRVSWAFMTWRN